MIKFEFDWDNDEFQNTLNNTKYRIEVGEDCVYFSNDVNEIKQIYKKELDKFWDYLYPHHDEWYKLKKDEFIKRYPYYACYYEGYKSKEQLTDIAKEWPYELCLKFMICGDGAEYYILFHYNDEDINTIDLFNRQMLRDGFITNDDIIKLKNWINK